MRKNLEGERDFIYPFFPSVSGVRQACLPKHYAEMEDLVEIKKKEKRERKEDQKRSNRVFRLLFLLSG